VLDRPGEAPGLSLACAIVPFQLVMLTVVNGLGAISGRETIIANMAFPREYIPAASALTEAAAFAASLVLLALMMVLYGIPPTTATLWLPVVVVVNLTLAVAISYPAALIGLWLADLRPFVVSFVRALYFLAPGLVALNEIPGRANELVRLNPLTGLFEAYRDALLYGRAPEAWELIYPLTGAAVLIAIFLPIYLSEQRHVAKMV
jgi:ABC-type polysaccharide/polyol phosphate export permease